MIGRRLAELYDSQPRCGAPIPGEPGPMCVRPPGHEGNHVSASGLFVWPQKEPQEKKR